MPDNKKKAKDSEVVDFFGKLGGNKEEVEANLSTEMARMLLKAIDKDKTTVEEQTKTVFNAVNNLKEVMSEKQAKVEMARVQATQETEMAKTNAERDVGLAKVHADHEIEMTKAKGDFTIRSRHADLEDRKFGLEEHKFNFGVHKEMQDRFEKHISDPYENDRYWQSMETRLFNEYLEGERNIFGFLTQAARMRAASNAQREVAQRKREMELKEAQNRTYIAQSNLVFPQLLPPAAKPLIEENKETTEEKIEKAIKKALNKILSDLKDE